MDATIILAKSVARFAYILHAYVHTRVIDCTRAALSPREHSATTFLAYAFLKYFDDTDSEFVGFLSRRIENRCFARTTETIRVPRTGTVKSQIAGGAESASFEIFKRLHSLLDIPCVLGYTHMRAGKQGVSETAKSIFTRTLIAFY